MVDLPHRRHASRSVGLRRFPTGVRPAFRCFAALAATFASCHASDASAASAFASPSSRWGDWFPNTAKWKKHMDKRLAQVKRIPDRQQRFDAFINLALQGQLVPNFTSTGFAVRKQPAGLHDWLNRTMHERWAEFGYLEEKIDVIEGDVLPDFVDFTSSKGAILHELQPYLEDWIGGSIKLEPTNAYGARLYRENHTLLMHLDHVDTHVISAVVHIDRDLDEPWPIAIENYQGETVEVDLEPGEMLLYESCKLIHGRPRKMKGKFYGSIFVHFRPVDWPVTVQDAIQLFGEDFEDYVPPDGTVPVIQMIGTGYVEPECDDGWCGLSKHPRGEELSDGTVEL